MNTDRITECLTGPFASLHTPFNRDGSIDYDSVRNTIDFDIAAGSKTIMLTAGDSHYICLSDEEIAEITKVTCAHTAGRAMVIAADRWHSTDRAVRFADYAKNIGADMVMCMPPDWACSCTVESLSDHYARVAEQMPVMIVTNVFIPRGNEFGLKTVELSLQKSDNIAAVKDDMCGDFARQLSLLAHDRAVVVAGGQKQNHMNMWPYGCDGYLSTFISFKPGIAHRYWTAIQAKDMDTARSIIADYDMPFFDYIVEQPGDFDAAMHGVLELFGITKRWRRKPYHTITDEEMERLADFLKRLKVL